MKTLAEALFGAVFIGILAMSASAVTGGESPGTVVYSRDVAPILRTYCVGCHSRAEAQSGLSLQSADDILKGGEHGLILDQNTPAQGRLAQVVVSTGDDHMPPADQPQPTAEQLRILQTWLAEGAVFDSRQVVMPTLPVIPVRTEHVRHPILAMQISGDGQRLLVGRQKHVEILDAASGSPSWSFPVPDGKVLDVRFSPDESRVLIATGTAGLSGRALEISLADSNLVREFAGHNDLLYAAAWTADGSVVATAGYDRRIILHDRRSGAVLRELTGHNGAIFDLDFSPDGTLLASASADATVKIWNVATGERMDTLGQPLSEQYAVVFAPDGQSVLGAGADSRIRKWQLVSRTAPQINPILVSRFAHEGAVTSLRISADGRYLATAAESGTTKIWRADTVEELAAFPGPQDSTVTCLALNPAAPQVWIARSTGELQTQRLPDIGSQPAPDPFSEMVATGPAGGSTELPQVAEAEPNDTVDAPQRVEFPVRIDGLVSSTTSEPVTHDADVYAFSATRGRPVLLEVKAARDGSPLDSFVEVLSADGQHVLQVQLQAVRDSYFTFRGKDSETSDDFRMFNWQEMEVNEYLYADGEVVRLWLYPRGPDSGFKVYPGFGQRETQFGTSPTSHPLQGPAFIVIPHGPQAKLRDTGLPVFPVYCENDDDPIRQWGRDSRVVFNPPADGVYLARIRDARGLQGADYKYQLLIRDPRPDFTVARGGDEITIHGGTGRELSFTATRMDGYTGPIEITAENLPAGFSLSDPVVIQDEQRQAFATLIASSDVVQPSAEAVAAVKFKARARLQDQEVVHEIGGLKSLTVAQDPKIRVVILTLEQHAAGITEQTPELTVYAGETVRAILKVDRVNHTGLVEFGKEDSGRNLPHGVFVDNIGLNGLMLLEGQNEREFFITTAKWVPETSRPFFLKSSVDGITTLPVMVHVRHRSNTAASTSSAE